MTKSQESKLSDWLKESELYENPFTEKQKNILAAAEELFGRHGFAETSTSEIAKKAGVTEKTLFKHFPKKTDLLRRIVFGIAIKTIVPMQVRMMQQITSRDFQSFEDMFETIALNRFETGEVHGTRIKVLLEELLFNPKFQKDFIELFSSQVLTFGSKLMERMQERGLVRSDIPVRMLIGTMLSVIIGTVFSRIVLGAKWIEKDELRRLGTLLAEGYTPTRDRQS